MTISRLDGVSVALNCLLISLLAFFIFDVYPIGKVEAGTLSVSDSGPETLLQPRCDDTSDLPASVTGYVSYASSCLLTPESGITVLDGDVLMMFHRLNEIRKENGLAELRWHDGAAEAARVHAADMLKRAYFAHKTPEGLKSSDRLRRIDRMGVFGASGENLSYYKSGWPDDYSSLKLQQPLEKSPSHFRTMINPDYTHAGAAIVKKGSTYIAVQVFLAAEGDLPEDWPTRLEPGDEFQLPAMIGQRAVGGWRLLSPDNQVVAKASDRRVRVPDTSVTELRLVVLGEQSRSAFILLNAPVADLHQPLSN